MRAAIYSRVSTGAQEERGTSLDSQRASCQRHANEIGATVVAEFQDIDSGSKEQIPGLLAMTDAAKRGEFDLVIVDHPDRFSRNLTKKVLYRRDLLQSGVQIVYVAMRVDDSAEGRLLENISAVVAEYERERIAFRTTRGRYAKASRGLVVGTGTPPYGYAYVRHDDLVVGLAPDPVTAPIIRRIFDLLLTSSAQEIATMLDAEQIPPPRGQHWVNTSILHMARNPAYAGRAAFGQSDQTNGGNRRTDPSEWIYADVPPLVSQSQWDRVQDAIHERNLGGHVRLSDDPYILRGLLTCGHCGKHLACVPNNGRRYYVCTRHNPSQAARQGHPVCPLPALRAETLECLVLGSIRAALLDTASLRRTIERQTAAQARAPEIEQSQARDQERRRYLHRLRQAQDLLLDAEPGTDSYRDLRDRARDAQEHLTRLDAATESPPPTPEISAAEWSSLEQFASSLRTALDEGLAAQDWPAILDALHVRPIVTADPDGITIGRHTYTLSLRALFPEWDTLLHRKNVFSITSTPFSIPVRSKAG